MNLVSWESLLNLLLDNAKISIFSKVDKMYLLLYWVTYTCTCKPFTIAKRALIFCENRTYLIIYKVLLTSFCASVIQTNPVSICIVWVSVKIKLKKKRINNNNNVKFLYSALHMSQSALTIITAAYRICKTAITFPN